MSSSNINYTISVFLVFFNRTVLSQKPIGGSFSLKNELYKTPSAVCRKNEKKDSETEMRKKKPKFPALKREIAKWRSISVRPCFFSFPFFPEAKKCGTLSRNGFPRKPVRQNDFPFEDFPEKIRGKMGFAFSQRFARLGDTLQSNLKKKRVRGEFGDDKVLESDGHRLSLHVTDQ